MRQTGRLQRWDDERGFGFIAPLHGTAEIFVHISEFARDGSRPTLGEALEFEIGTGKNGRSQAVRIKRLALGDTATASRRSASRQTRSRFGPLLVLALILVIAVASYRWFSQRAQRLRLEIQPAVPRVDPAFLNRPAPTAPEPYRCDGRTHCSQMTSCAEATWFINHCPGTKMDGNHDGVPCEQQWCSGPGAR